MSKVEIDPNQVSLTEEQQEALAQEAIAEAEAEEKGTPKEKETPEDPKPEKKPEEEEEPQEEPEGEEDPKEEEKPEEDKPAEEEKPEEEDPDKKEESEEEKSQKQAEEFEQRANDYAVKEGLSLDEAKEELRGQEGIVNKYQKDPLQIAKAFQHTQRAYDKLKNDHTQTEEQLKSLQAQTEAAQKEATVEGYLAKNREGLIKQYRDKYPGKSESMSDEAVFDEVKEKVEKVFSDKYKEALDKQAKAAENRRAELIESVPEADKKFLPEVRDMLKSLSDPVVLQKDFDLKDSILWAKGRHYDQDVKSAYERGVKQGKEKPVIAGEKPESPRREPKPKPKGPQLSEAYKQRALEMFEGQDMKDEEKYQAFYEIHKEDIDAGNEILV